jgi:signal transduction histidine kinase
MATILANGEAKVHVPQQGQRPKRREQTLRLAPKLILHVALPVGVIAGLTLWMRPEACAALALPLLACMVVVAATVQRLVVRPLGRISQQVRRIADGDLSGRVGLDHDDEIGRLAEQIDAMTERLQDARDQLTAEAERRVAALDELRHAERLKTVGQLASGVAHELGTPLNVVEGRARMIARGQIEGKDVVDSALIIVEQTQRMSKLIRHLLTYARRRPAPRQRIDLAAHVGHAAALIEPMAHKARVQIRVEAGEGPFAVDGDMAQVEQVLANLLMNATQAMTPQGGEVLVRLERLSGATHPEGHTGDFVRVSVADRGVGMTPEVQARIFEPFFTTKDVGVGTGLGLSVAFGIVRDHGGWIEVESAPGEGSTFRLHLPAA